MANRYWVGGTASWDGTAGTKWAATSGGPGGESVPTTADDVFFDAASTGTVTIATGNTGAKSINCTEFTGTITGTAAISVAGSITLVTGMTYTHTGTVTMSGTGTLITAGKQFSNLTVDGVGITVTLGDALDASARTVTITRGTFDTANFNMTAAGFQSFNSNTRTINLGSSTITVTASNGPISIYLDATNLTFNAGTSQINLTNANPFLYVSGSLTFNNVTFTNTNVGNRTIYGSNTFNNLTNTVGTTAGLYQILLNNGNQTINGTFTCAGAALGRRGYVRSQTLGTARTITAAAIAADDCDFRDITLSGAAAGSAPNRAGDCGGNSGITFPTPKTVYRVGTNTSWPGSNSWATSSNGTGSDNNFPLVQDTVIIDNSPTPTSLQLVTLNIGTVDMSNRTTSLSVQHNVSATRYGSYILGSGVTISGTSQQTFSGRGTMVFTSAGKTITSPLVVDTPGGTFRLGDAYNSTNTITLTQGTFDAFNYNLTCTTFSSSNSSTPRVITMGSGLWTLTGTGTVWNTSNNTNFTLNKDTANILLSDVSTTNRSFFGGAGISFNKLTIGGATGTSTTLLSTASNFGEIASTKTVAHTIRLDTNLGTIGTWSVTGSAGNVVTLNAFTAGTRRTFTLTNITSGIDYLDVKDIGVLSANKFYVGTNSINNGNNNNVYFTNPPDTTVAGKMLLMFF